MKQIRCIVLIFINNNFNKYMLRLFKLFLVSTFLSSTSMAWADPAAEALHSLDGDWYSQQWKYGYTVRNGVGVATSTNSPNFKVGQVILKLQPTSMTTFEGEQVYTDGKFYKVTAELDAKGQLRFSGEKNAKWTMARGTAPAQSAQAPTGGQATTTAVASERLTDIANCFGVLETHKQYGNDFTDGNQKYINKNVAEYNSKIKPTAQKVNQCRGGTSDATRHKACAEQLAPAEFTLYRALNGGGNMYRNLMNTDRVRLGVVLLSCSE